MPNDDDTEIEAMVLVGVLDLHPDHLTTSELVLKMAAEQGEDDEIRNAIRDLERSGLLRSIGDAVAPTHAALRAAALLRL